MGPMMRHVYPEVATAQVNSRHFCINGILLNDKNQLVLSVVCLSDCLSAL